VKRGGGGAWAASLVGVVGRAVRNKRMVVAVGRGVRVSVAVRKLVWVGSGEVSSVLGSRVSVNRIACAKVSVGVKISVGVRVKRNKAVGVGPVLGRLSSAEKANRPLNPSHNKTITGIAKSSHANPSRRDDEIMGSRRRTDLGISSFQPLTNPGQALWVACRQVVRW
jgi:hypothetical protein